jgi:hypothetical protein
MLILLIIACIIAFIIIAVFYAPVKIYCLLDTEIPDMSIRASWLSFLRVTARVIEYRLYIQVFLFNLNIVSRYLKSKGKRQRPADLIRAPELHGTEIKIRYGLNEPNLTGIFFSAAEFIAALIDGARVEIYPDFLPIIEFLRVEAATNLNIGRTVLNLAQLKRAHHISTNKETQPWISSA